MNLHSSWQSDSRKKLMLNGLLMDLLRWYSLKVLLYSSLLLISSGVVNHSRWSLLQLGLSRRLPGKLLHDLRHLVFHHLAARLSCAVRFFARGNGNFKLLGRNRRRVSPALGPEREVLGLQLLHLGLHVADLFEDLLLEGSVSGRSGRHRLLRARFAHRHVLLGELEHPRPQRARGLDGAESRHRLLDAVGCASRQAHCSSHSPRQYGASRLPDELAARACDATEPNSGS